jgi:hypothetical protein
MCVCLAAPLAGIPVEESTIGFFAQTRCDFRKCCAEPAHKEVHDSCEVVQKFADRTVAFTSTKLTTGGQSLPAQTLPL